MGQALDLDAGHAERSIGRATHLELGPGVDTDFAIGGVNQSSRLLRLAMCGVIGQPKRLTMQARPSSAWMPLRSAIYHTVFGQAHQEVRVSALCASASRS